MEYLVAPTTVASFDALTDFIAHLEAAKISTEQTGPFVISPSDKAMLDGLILRAKRKVAKAAKQANAV